MVPCLRVVLTIVALCCATGAQAQQPRGEAIRLQGVPGPYGETLAIDDKGITLSFPDDAAKLRIGGRLQLDYGVAAIRQPGFGEPFPDTIAVRRSWIENYLSLGKTIELAFQYDFANPMLPINDALILYRGQKGSVLEDTIVSLGNEKEPFGLDQLLSDNTTLFTERSLADAFAPARNFGAAIGRSGQDWSFVTGVFAGNPNTGIESGGIASTTRLTYAPIQSESETLHLGLAGSYRSLQRNDDPLSLSSRSEAFLFQRQFVDTGDIRDASSVGRIGAELAYRNGPLLVMAEYVRTQVGRFDHAGALGFQGGYVQASYVLNGDNRAYKLVPNFVGTTYATFGGVTMKEGQCLTRGGFGVFELAARFSAIDLDDGGVRGGIERDATVGLTWYPDRNVRVMADYVRSHTRPSTVELGRRVIDADAFIGRFQLYW